MVTQELNLRIEVIIGSTDRYTIPKAIMKGYGLEIGDKLEIEIKKITKKEGKS